MIEDLEREGLIRRLPYDKKKVEDSLALAYRDLRTSHTILPTDQDWAYTIAYNAVLQAGRALMFAKGFRPDGANQHIAVVKFVELFVDQNDAIIFDRMRRSGTVRFTIPPARSPRPKQNRRSVTQNT
jgi:hypothetical protein